MHLEVLEGRLQCVWGARMRLLKVPTTVMYSGCLYQADSCQTVDSCSPFVFAMKSLLCHTDLFITVLRLLFIDEMFDTWENSDLLYLVR